MGRLDVSPRSNWVEKRGGLPDYIDRIAVHLHDKGMPISQAIAVAINVVKKACATGDLNYPGMQQENAGSRAEACAAVAQWEALKASHDGEPALALASWNSLLHPRVPAGSAGGGMFASGSGGAKKAGGAKKTGAKKTGGAKKGAKGKKPGAHGKAHSAGKKPAKASVSAAATAQAKIVYGQFLKMTPQQRAVFLSKLSNPQLAALYKAANAGNTNDPATRSALIAIKDQMAARSLTGTKGPTATNAAKAKSAAHSAAGKRASAAKRTTSAAHSAAAKRASAAKKTTSAAHSAAAKQASAAKKTTTAQHTAARKQLAAAKAAAAVQAKAQKSTVANQAAALKAQAAMKAPTQKAQVAGLTSALKATSNPAQQRQILAQLKTALGLAQTVGARETLALAFMPNTGSADGPDIIVNGSLKSPRDVRMAVAGHGKVPPHRQAAYRKKVMSAAKAMGPDAMKHVPPAWMKDSVAASHVALAAEVGLRFRHGWIPIDGTLAASGNSHGSHLANMPTKDHSSHVRGMATADLHATDADLTTSAHKAGVPPGSTSHHAAVKDELASRAVTNRTDQQRIERARANETATKLTSGMLGKAGPVKRDTTPNRTDQARIKRAATSRAAQPVAVEKRPARAAPARKKKGAPPPWELPGYKG